MTPLPLVPIWAGAFLATLLGVAGFGRWAVRNAVLDVPNARSSHTTPTPRGGGLAIVVVALGGAVGASGGAPDGPWSWFVGGALVAVVSWVDDLRGVSNRVRFACHLAAAVLVLFSAGFWTELAISGTTVLPLGAAGAVLSALWIVGLTNAYNFMDGIDGIAGGQGVVAGCGWAMVGALASDPWVIAVGGLLAASCAAFLLFNWSPARIFMGDVGSATLGFIFATLPFVTTQESEEITVRLPIAGLLLVWPFVFDAVYTFGHRLSRGENVFEAHQSHLYQRLVRSGWAHRSVATLYVALTCQGVIAAWLWLGASPVLATVSALMVLVLAGVLVYGVTRVESDAAKSGANV